MAGEAGNGTSGALSGVGRLIDVGGGGGGGGTGMGVGIGGAAAAAPLPNSAAILDSRLVNRSTVDDAGPDDPIRKITEIFRNIKKKRV
jgi:hypothetical protein